MQQCIRVRLASGVLLDVDVEVAVTAARVVPPKKEEKEVIVVESSQEEGGGGQGREGGQGQ